MPRLNVAEIRARRVMVALTTARRLARPAHPPRPMEPVGIRLAYTQALRAFVRVAEAIIRELVMTQLEAIAQEAKATRPDGLHQDAVDKTIERLIGDVKVQFAHRLPKARASAIADQFSKEIDRFNWADVGRQVKAILGIDLWRDPNLKPHLASFVSDNATLITSIPEDLLFEVEGIMSRGTRRGRRAEDMASDIEDRFGVSESRAALIARDQTNKLNGELTELRQTDLGITTYVWRTSMDERVRGNPNGKYPDAEPSHWDREGKAFKWADPPEDGHPGEAIQCRCTAEPVLDEILEGLEG